MKQRIRDELMFLTIALIIYPLLSMVQFWQTLRGRKSILLIKDAKPHIISSETLRTALRDPGRQDNERA
jgi:hypothetical protein